MQSELKKTRQYYRSVGSVYELGLKLEDCDCKTKDKDGNEKTVKGERIMGTVALRTKDGIHTHNVYFQSISMDGTENKRWKMAQDMLNWNPEINGTGEEPTLVALEGQVDVNDYVKEDTVYTNLRWRVGKATTKVSADEITGTTLEAICFLNSFSPEVVNEEETGRLKVVVMGANNKGACFPINAIVDKDLADDFQETFEIGMTLPLTIELQSRHIGGDAKKGKPAFGRKSDVAVNTGFDVDELIIIGSEEPVEEPEEQEDEEGNPIEDKSGYINPSVMKKAIKVRAAMLEKLKNNPPEKKSKKPESFADKKARAKSVGKTNTNKSPIPDDDGDPDF